MKIKILTMLANLAWLSSYAAHASPILTLNCGGEGMQACTPADPEYSGGYTDISQMACDRLLKAVVDAHGNSTCVAYKRSTLANEFTSKDWVGFAMRDQMYSIAAHQQANWGSYFGTHNSYMTYADNANMSLSADQVLTITDQLQAGARVIRLDPRRYDGQVRLCHASSNDITDDSGNHNICNTTADILGFHLDAPTSKGRLYALSMHEVGVWLKKNPGEFLFIRMLGTRGLTSGNYNLIDAAIVHELGGMVYTPTATTLAHWPSLRELRGSGKRVVIASDTGTGQTWSWDTYVQGDGYSDSPGFGLCENAGNPAVHIGNRPVNQWSYIGEDRSLSNTFSNNQGVLGQAEVAKAAQCAYSLINVDFLLGGQAAYSSGWQPIWNYGYNKLEKIDYTFPDPDQRRSSFIWSWGPGDTGSAGPAMLVTKNTAAVSLLPHLRSHWYGEADQNQHRFACARLAADGLPDPDRPSNYQWSITTQRDSWEHGEDACQSAFGSTFHFWAPANGEENINLLGEATRLGLSEGIWLNHIAGQLTATAKVLSLTPTTSAAFTVLGGNGVKLSAKVIPGADLTVTVNGTNIEVQPKSTVNSLKPGKYSENILVSEIDPATGVVLDSSPLLLIPVTITIPSATLHLLSSYPGSHVLLDGMDYTTPFDVRVKPGSIHVLAPISPLNIGAGTREVFQSWANGGAAIQFLTVPAAGLTVTSNYARQFLVTVNTTPVAGGKVSGGGWYNANSQATLTAIPTWLNKIGFIPAIHYQFIGFSGDVTTTNNPTKITVNSPKNVIANFKNVP